MSFLVIVACLIESMWRGLRPNRHLGPDCAGCADGPDDCREEAP